MSDNVSRERFAELRVISLPIEPMN